MANIETKFLTLCFVFFSSHFVYADCFLVNEKLTKEIEAQPGKAFFVDNIKKDFLITTTCQRSNLTPSTLLASHKNMGKITHVNDKFSYLTVIGKKPVMMILYSFGTKTGTYLFVSSNLTAEKSLEKVKETIDSGLSKDDLEKIKI